MSVRVLRRIYRLLATGALPDRSPVESIRYSAQTMVPFSRSKDVAEWLPRDIRGEGVTEIISAVENTGPTVVLV